MTSPFPLRSSTSPLVIILGPTASGKSHLALNLARKFKGEIISADSRQVYKGMNLGTGKVSKKEQKLVCHHLLDVASPKKQFTVSDFTRQAKIAIKKIQQKKRIPFIVGGTAFYIYALIDNLNIPEVKPNLKLRRALEKKSIKELVVILKNLDPKRLKTIDKNNRVRLIRAIEINIVTGQPVSSHLSFPRKRESFQGLILGIKKNSAELRKLINKRVDQRLKQGMVNEVRKLRKSRLSFKRLESFGLEYRFIAQYLQNKITYEQMVEKLKTAIYQFSKRQMTWFKRDKRIQWVTNKKQAQRLVKRHIN